MMQPGDDVVLTEHVLTIGHFGSEMVLKGTRGKLLGLEDGFAEVETSVDTYRVPIGSIERKEAA